MFQDEKIKVKILGLPINKKGELVLDYKNTESLTLSLYMLLETLTTKQRIESQSSITAELDFNTKTGTYKVADIQVVAEQQPPINDISAGGLGDDAGARAKINEILAMLRTHGLIETP